MIQLNKKDYHIHTVVSDGEMTPGQILQKAKLLGLTQISITDHDAVGAYFNFSDNVFAKADELGIELIPGIELDSLYEGCEMHILGYEIDLKDPDLNNYLKGVQRERRQRIKEQIEAINNHFQKELIPESEIFLPFRDTLMKPHLVNYILKSRIFSHYREAATWLNANIRVSSEVSKPSAKKVIQMIIKAGGKPILAHPGYIIREQKLNIENLLNTFIRYGLKGIEVDYPYYKTSPAFKAKSAEKETIAQLRSIAHDKNLLTTCGSDAHTIEQLQSIHNNG